MLATNGLRCSTVDALMLWLVIIWNNENRDSKEKAGTILQRSHNGLTLDMRSTACSVHSNRFISWPI